MDTEKPNWGFDQYTVGPENFKAELGQTFVFVVVGNEFIIESVYFSPSSI